MLRVVLFTLCLLVGPLAPSAAQTGKLAGFVLETGTDRPVAHAELRLDPGRHTSTTGSDGSFLFLRVPPGSYRLSVRAAGYEPGPKLGVTAHPDSTTRLQIRLVRVEGRVYDPDSFFHRHTSEWPRRALAWLRRKPEATTEFVVHDDASDAGVGRTLDAEELRTGRYPDLTRAVAAQPGADAVGAYADRPTFRGADFGEAAFFLDGFRLIDPWTREPYLRSPLPLLDALTVQTASYDASIGDFRSGVVRAEPLPIGDRLTGGAVVQASPAGRRHFGPSLYGFDSPLVRPFVDPEAGAFTGNAFFEGWNAVAEEDDDFHQGRPMEWYALWLWQHRSPEAIDELERLEREGVVAFASGVDPDEEAFFTYGDRPDVRASAWLGGPVPGLPRLRALVAFDVGRTAYAYRFARPDYTDRQVLAKLTIPHSARTRLSALVFRSEQQGGNGIPELPDVFGWISSNPFAAAVDDADFWHPDRTGVNERRTSLLGFTLTHRRSDRLSAEFRVARSASAQDVPSHLRNATLLSQTAYGYDQTGRIGLEAYADTLSVQFPEDWANWRAWAPIRIGDAWYDRAPFGTGLRYGRDASDSYRISGDPWVDSTDTRTRTLSLSGHLTARPTSRSSLHTGFEARRLKLHHFAYTVYSACCASYIDSLSARPLHWNAFSEGRFELGRLTTRIGVRVDGLRNAPFPLLDGEGSADNGPFSPWLTARHSDWGRRIPSRRSHRVVLNPRLHLAYTVWRDTRLFAAYGRYSQWPDPRALYGFHFNRNRYIDLYGNPLLKPPRTTAFELGIEGQFLQRLRFRLSAYARDTADLYRDARFYYESNRSYRQAGNLGYRDVRGLEIFLHLPGGVIPWLGGRVHLDLFSLSGGWAGFDRFYEDPERPPEPVDLPEQSPDVRPLLKLNPELRVPDGFGPAFAGAPLLGGLDASLLFTWKRGARLTWNPDGYPGVEDNLRWRAYRRWDLRLSKTIVRAGGTTAAFTLDVVNLFNQRHLTPYPEDALDVTTNTAWAWDGHHWWDDTFTAYMESLDLSVAPDGRVTGPHRPGDWKDDSIELPPFTPWLFLERREVAFGVRVGF